MGDPVAFQPPWPCAYSSDSSHISGKCNWLALTDWLSLFCVIFCQLWNGKIFLFCSRYPSSLQTFSRSRLPGPWDSSRAGKRMKLPQPETWERELSLRGNKASVWEELIGRVTLTIQSHPLPHSHLYVLDPELTSVAWYSYSLAWGLHHWKWLGLWVLPSTMPKQTSGVCFDGTDFIGRSLFQMWLGDLQALINTGQSGTFSLISLRSYWVSHLIKVGLAYGVLESPQEPIFRTLR